MNTEGNVMLHRRIRNYLGIEYDVIIDYVQFYGKKNHYVTNLDKEMSKENHPPSSSKTTNTYNQKRKQEQGTMDDSHANLFTERSSKKNKVTINNKTKAKDRMKSFSSGFPITSPPPSSEPII